MLPGLATGIAGLMDSGVPTVSTTISTNQNKLNLFTLAGSPSGVANYVFTINSGVVVYSDSTGTAALSTGTFPAGSTLKLINNGNIYGKGGQGGFGGLASLAGDGAAGGNAMSLAFDISIDNTNGNIFGGGGGGGGGGSGGASEAETGGGGGGGGQSSTQSQSSGGAGGGGGATAGGSGSATGPGSGGSPDSDGGSGGAGGAWGAAGNNGGAGTRPSQRGAGGAAGKAIALNSKSVTWLGGNNGTQVKGAVS